MLDELQIVESLNLHCKDILEHQKSKQFDDDYVMLLGIICGLLISLNKFNPYKVKSDLIGYTIEVMNEILDKNNIEKIN